MTNRELIKPEYININGKKYKKYAFEGYHIIQVETDIKYTEAIDVENAKFTYIKSDEKIIVPETPDVK